MRQSIPIAVASFAFACLATVLFAADSIQRADLPGIDVQLPSEGRWSIATEWKEGWPADWHHARSTGTETVGDWTLYRGHLALAEGDWLLQDAVRTRGEGLIECRRRWQWLGTKPLDRVTLSVRWQVDAGRSRPFLPGVSYYDNPAGRKINSSRVPVIGAQPGCKGFYEEHRFPMPAASIEAEKDGKVFVAALHSRPSPLRHGHRDDQWWSLGVEYHEGKVELALLSGPVASNGRNSVIKVGQRKFLPYDDAYLTVTPGAVIEKSFFVQLTPSVARGSGFRSVVWQSVDLFKPTTQGRFPPLKETIRLKMVDTRRRWREDDRFAGIDAFPDTGKERPWIDLGWAGQSEAAAYPFILLGKRLDFAEANTMAQKSLDFIANAPFDKRGFFTRYDYKAHRWLPQRNRIKQAQAMNNMFNALRVARKDPRSDTTKWETFLRRACELHSACLLDERWRPKSTGEAFLIAPLAQGSELFNELRYLKAARRAADHYAVRHLSMDEPYWGGTLDARCEDKEGAWAALQGFLAMYEVTCEKKYLDWAQHAADVVVSYVYVWDVPMPGGRLADHVFRSSGWTAVSVQNMHLDVYGVLCVPALWRIGDLTGRQEYKDVAKLMMVTCGQLVDPLGGQGEQILQTNFAQHYQVQKVDGLRGDYAEDWKVYWITAHFLTAVSQLDEMGVEWEKW